MRKYHILVGYHDSIQQPEHEETLRTSSVVKQYIYIYMIWDCPFLKEIQQDDSTIWGGPTSKNKPIKFRCITA